LANITFESRVTWTGEGVSSDAITGPHTVRIDEPEQLGGQNTGPNPVEYVLSALGGCLVVLLASFAPAHGVTLTGVRVDVEGDLDPDGFLERADVRPGFSAIRYRIRIDSPSAPADIEALKAHALRVCPVKDTLRGVPVEPCSP
jgi:uncharacterized OsmC-like protein